MIGLFTGVPRSGKSYTVVYRIAKKYCEKIDGEYELKDDYLLISDIEGLTIDHEPLEKYMFPNHEEPEKKQENVKENDDSRCPNCNSPLVLRNGKYGNFYACTSYPNCKYSINESKFTGSVSSPGSSPGEPNIKNLFSEQGFELLRKKHPEKKIVILIDECQRYFHKKFYDRDVFLAFEKHGHWGLDIYLIAHNVKKVSADIINLIEFETRIIPRTFQIPGFFSYLEKQGYEVVGRGRTPKKQEVFRLYKSQHFEQGDKVSKPFLKYFAFTLCVLFIGVYFFYTRVISRLDKVSSNHSPVVQAKQNTHAKENEQRPGSFFSSQPPAAVPAKVKSRSLLSARDKAGYVYKPLSSLVMHENGKEVLYVPYQGNLIPVAMYPYKTIVSYKNGHPTIYELKPINENEKDIDV